MVLPPTAHNCSIRLHFVKLQANRNPACGSTNFIDLSQEECSHSVLVTIYVLPLHGRTTESTNNSNNKQIAATNNQTKSNCPNGNKELNGMKAGEDNLQAREEEGKLSLLCTERNQLISGWNSQNVEIGIPWEGHFFHLPLPA